MEFDDRSIDEPRVFVHGIDVRNDGAGSVNNDVPANNIKCKSNATQDLRVSHYP